MGGADREAGKERDRRRFERQFERLQRRMPGRSGAWLGRLRCPAAVWVRVPVALLLIGCGFLGFLPVLGFWMVPVGLILLAIDLPFLRRPIGRGLVRAEWAWRGLRRRYRGRAGQAPRHAGPHRGAARSYPTAGGR